MAEREWHGRVKPIFDANQGPIARSGGQNPLGPRRLIGRLHVLASRLRPAISDWLDIGQELSHSSSLSCRTLSTGHNAVDLYRHHAGHWRSGEEAHDVERD